jgi:ferredoxin
LLSINRPRRHYRLAPAARSHTEPVKAHVSRDCGAHRQRNWINPGLFPLDDDGYSAVGDLLVPDGTEADARRAAAACPAAAILIEPG